MSGNQIRLYVALLVSRSPSSFTQRFWYVADRSLKVPRSA